MRLETFIYNTGYVALPNIAGSVTPTVLNIAADADFECNYITITVVQAGLIVTNWSGSVLIEDSAVGRELMQNALSVESIRGTGQQPYYLKPARIFVGNSTLTISFTNPVATATNVELALHGNKRKMN